MKMRTSALYASVASLMVPAPARSELEVVGGGSVHQGGTRRITVIGDGINFATSVTSSDARIGVRLLSKKGLAPQTWSSTPGRRILAGWQNNWRYAQKVPTMPWRGQLSIPRNLGLIRDDGTYWLTQTPVPELAVLRKSAAQRVTRLRDKPLTNRTPAELPNFRSTAFDADLAIDVAGLPKVNSEIKIHLRAGNKGQGMVLSWRRTGSNQGELSLTRSASEAGGATSELIKPESGFIGRWLSASLPLAMPTIGRFVSGFKNTQPSERLQITRMPVVARGTNNNLLKLRILVDRSSVEVFAGDGRVVLSSLFFPNSSSKEFKIYATEGNAKIVSLVIYPFSDD